MYRLTRDRGGEYQIIAVADGASGSVRADIGAAVAATAAVTEIRRRLDAGVTPGELKAPAARVLQLFPTHAAAAYQLGRCLADLGSPAEAAVALRRALAIDPGHAAAQALLRKVEAPPLAASVAVYGGPSAVPAPAQWSLDSLVEAARSDGIEVARSQIRRILLDEQVRCRHTRSWAASTDPEFVPKERRSSSELPPGMWTP